MHGLYLVHGEDVADSEVRRAPVRAPHIERRRVLDAEGRIVVSGPLADGDQAQPYSGSLLVAEFESLEQAVAWARADPYVTAGVYQRLTVRRIVPHFPEALKRRQP